MREIAPGLWHWSARHERIHVPVSSYYLVESAVALDPMLPSDGLEWFERTGPPRHVVLSNRHHDRHAWRLHEAFGCEVHCVSNGVHELVGRGPVSPFEFGDVLPGGITAYEVDAICPDETALHIPAHRALACADGVVRSRESGELSFVPDSLMDEPEQTKAGLRAAYRRLLGLDFDLLLLAHGEPVLQEGRKALNTFVG
jgi:hypothetical protein